MGTSNGCKPVVIGGLVTVLIAACTSSSPQQRRSTAPLSTVASSPGPSTRPVGGPVELSCTDSASGTLGGSTGNLTVNGLTLESAGAQLQGHEVTPAEFRTPAGRTLYFTKAPAYLKAGTSAITVELAPRSNGYLAWVPGPVWTSGNRPVDLRPWATSRLTFHGCPDRDTTYLGGLLASDPHICLTVHIRRAGISKQVRLGGTSC